MSVTYVSDKKYTTETIACAFKYFALYRAAYNRPGEDPELPGVRTFTGLISKVKTTDNSSYLHKFLQILMTSDKEIIFYCLTKFI